MCAAIWTTGVAAPLNDAVVGKTTYRLINSKYPPIALFENLLDPDELEVAYALESLTNDRLRQEAGDLYRVPPQDRLVGPGSSPIMAAFTHVGFPSRFSDGRFGIYYAGLERQTGIAESMYSQARRLSATAEGPVELTLRAYTCRVNAPLLDVTGDGFANLHLPDDWSPAQRFGESARNKDEKGILYRSVRMDGGHCIAALRTRALKPPATQAAHYRFVWNGTAITDVLKIEAVRINN